MPYEDLVEVHITDIQNMIWFSIRYALQRNTAVWLDISEFIERYGRHFSEWQVEKMIKEIRGELERQHGMCSDIMSGWEHVIGLLEKEIGGRRNEEGQSTAVYRQKNGGDS